MLQLFEAMGEFISPSMHICTCAHAIYVCILACAHAAARDGRVRLTAHARMHACHYLVHAKPEPHAQCANQGRVMHISVMHISVMHISVMHISPSPYGPCPCLLSTSTCHSAAANCLIDWLAGLARRRQLLD